MNRAEALCLVLSCGHPRLHPRVTKTGYKFSGLVRWNKASFSEVKAFNRYGQRSRRIIIHQHHRRGRIVNQVPQPTQGERSGAPRSPSPRFVSGPRLHQGREQDAAHHLSRSKAAIVTRSSGARWLRTMTTIIPDLATSGSIILNADAVAARRPMRG